MAYILRVRVIILFLPSPEPTQSESLFWRLSVAKSQQTGYRYRHEERDDGGYMIEKAQTLQKRLPFL